MKDKKLFIILTTQRSGSTYLRTWLNSHQDVRCHEEIFLPDYWVADSFCGYLEHKFLGKRMIETLHNREKLSGILADQYLRSFLNYLLSEKPLGTPAISSIRNDSEKWDQRKTCNASWVGMKLMVNQFNLLPNLSTELRTRNVHVLILRRSGLKKYVSEIVAQKRGVFHSIEDLPPVKIELDPDTTIRAIQDIANKFERAIKSFDGCPQLEISYEEIFDQEKKVHEMERVLTFLGLSTERLGAAPNLRKVIRQPMKDVISNYDLIIDSLANAGVNP